jgi:hypothetical protein
VAYSDVKYIIIVGVINMPDESTSEEFNLLGINKIVNIINIIAQLLLFKSSSLSQVLEIGKMKGETIEFNPSPARIASIALWIILGTITTSATIATIRLNKLEQQSESGQTAVPLGPVRNFTIGAWIAALGVLIVAISAQQRVEQQNQIIII